MSWLFSSGGQSIGASVSVSVFPVKIQGWFPLGLTSLNSLLSKGLKCFLQYHSSKISTFCHSTFFMVHLSHPYMTTGKTIALTIGTLVGKVMSLFFNMLSRFVVAFLSRSKHLFISRLLSTVIFEAKKIKSVTASTFSLPICHDTMGPDAMILVSWMLSFNTTFSFSSLPSSRSSLVPLHCQSLEWYLLHIWGCWYFLQ